MLLFTASFPTFSIISWKLTTTTQNRYIRMDVKVRWVQLTMIIKWYKYLVGENNVYDDDDDDDGDDGNNSNNNTPA